MKQAISFAERLDQLPTVNPTPNAQGDLRSSAADFLVEEVLSFQPSGEGEHLFVQIKKVDANTDWVARQLQKKAGLTSREIGYAGKKDRHSISTQWFSLHLPGKSIDLSQLASDEYQIIQAVRHHKKLRRGSLQENKFDIVIRNLSEAVNTNTLDQIKKNGVPNYFGLQRFGFDGNNLVKVNELLCGRVKIKNRNKRGLMLSSARSFLFNLQLASRISENNWRTPIKGDCLMLDASQSFFTPEQLNDDDKQRVEQGDLHICGWLAGKQASEAKALAAQKEQQSMADYLDWINGLSQLNLDSARRSFICKPKNLTLEQDETSVRLTFSLAKGCFATALLRELVDFTDLAARTRSNTTKESSFANIN